MDRDGDFPPVHSAVNPLAAVTIGCALGERRQITLAINLSMADSLEVRNAMLDQAMHLLDRQQARYDLEQMEANFRQVGLNLRNMLAGLTTADHALKQRVELLKAQIEGKSEARDELYKQGYEKHVRSGKAGAYKPKGFEEANLARVDAEIQKLRDGLEAAPRDADQNRANLIASIQRNQQEVAERRAKINEARAMAGMEPNVEYSEEETRQV